MVTRGCYKSLKGLKWQYLSLKHKQLYVGTYTSHRSCGSKTGSERCIRLCEDCLRKLGYLW